MIGSPPGLALIYTIFTQTVNGQRVRVGKPYKHVRLFEEDFKRLQRINGKKITFTIEQRYDNQFTKELLTDGRELVRQMLKVSHADIYRANPIGEPFNIRTIQAFARFRAELKRRYLDAPVKGRNNRGSAKGQLQARSTDNQLWNDILDNMKGLI